MKYRIEKDKIGELKMPSEVYYGIYTLRGKENFQITKRGICRQLIKSVTIVKKAAAKANYEAGILDEKIAEAIMLACDEILNGRLHGQFVTDLIQGGAGESINMNANEVIANRANEMLGAEKGSYEFVHPILHVNYGQATNDVIPTAGKLAVIKQLKKLIVELKKLENSFKNKAKELNINKVVYEEFISIGTLLNKDIKKIEQVILDLSEINLGVTALLKNTPGNEKYLKKIIFYINKFSGEDLKHDKNLLASTRSLDSFLWTSSCIKGLAVGMSKAANDLTILASPEHKQILIPEVQLSSSNSFNPVIVEMINQVAFYVMGLDITVTKSVEAGQLSNNVFLPIILTSLFEAITVLRRAARTLRELVIDGIKLS